MEVSWKAWAKSRQAPTSAAEARDVSKKRRRFFEMSMGSISEAGACVDLAGAKGLLTPREAASYKSRLRLAYVLIHALR